MEFTTGLLLGAILGVVADRLWEKWEKRTRVSIVAGGYTSIDKGSGMTLTLTNIGVKEIPDFVLELFHPERGTLIAFNTTPNNRGPLLSGQQREFCCSLVDRDPERPMFRNWFFRANYKSVQDVTFDNFRFRLKMSNSSVILFESTTIGNALARIWVKALLCGNPLSASGADLWEVRHPKPSRWRRWLIARRMSRRAKDSAPNR